MLTLERDGVFSAESSSLEGVPGSGEGIPTTEKGATLQRKRMWSLQSPQEQKLKEVERTLSRRKERHQNVSPGYMQATLISLLAFL